MKKSTGLAMKAAAPVDRFLENVPPLSLVDRATLCEQALLLLDGLYVHLRLKRAMHAIDPTQRLRLLQRRLSDLTELEFQAELLDIFASLRDLHTRYSLGDPYRGRVATLGILVEQYFTPDGNPHYLVYHIEDTVRSGSFQPGVELLAWNGVPIHTAVERHAERAGGSNRAARFARGLEALTLRPLRTSLPPDERFVILEYQPDKGAPQEVRINWTVLDSATTSDKRGATADAEPVSVLAAAHGIDVSGEAVRRVKRRLYAPPNVRRAASEAGAFDRIVKCEQISSSTGETAAYLRIYSFNVTSASAFLAEVATRLASLAERRLIIDIRGNPGGHILAAEGLLALVSQNGAAAIEPERFSLTNTAQTLALCDNAQPLRQWTSSVSSAIETGEAYSQAFPLSDPVRLVDRSLPYTGKHVLVTDARCYSAADIFAAGFQDNDLGTVLGTDECTGAGGANVWSYELLQIMMPEPLPPLPNGASYRVALRRATRARDRIGVPLEDFGVASDEIHKLTYRDITADNQDLIDRAFQLF